MSTQRYTKKPVEIEAMEWDGTAAGATPIIDWILAGEGTARYHGSAPADPNCPSPGYHETHHYCPGCSFSDAGSALAIDTLEGTITASPGDFIIRGVKGEFYPCKPDIFAATYAPVGEPSMLDLVTAERATHPSRGFDADHDEGHVSDLVLAAVSYGIATAAGIDSGHPELMPTYPTWDLWPWPDEFWKPSADELRNLVKGASLILAAGDALMAERRKAADS